MTKPVAFSHSSLKDYEGCARRYHEVRVLKNYKQEQTEQIIYGLELHSAAEHYIGHNKPLPEQFQFVQPVLDAFIAKPGRKLVEQKMALTKDLQPCDFRSSAAWARGIADLIIINDDNMTAKVVDWKTGNNKYPDREQLRLMSMMVFAHHAHIRQVDAALVYVLKNDMVKARMLRDEAEPEWWRYRERIAKLEASFSNNVWNPKSSGLCPWCPVRGCEFHPKHHSP